jgi:hypothetical protein
LVVTWVGPVPEQAEVSYTDGAIFARAAAVTGPDMPRDLPAKYLKGLQRVELFNASISWDAQALTAWEKRYGIEMEREPLSVFEQYLKSGHVIFSTLVRHPTVPEPRFYAACSIILQRGVIVYANGTETLYLRSYFHSARDANTFVNFAPRGGLRISFKSDKIWFPLELTRFIQEPYSQVVLDVATPKSLDLKDLPKGFEAGRKGTLTVDGAPHQVVRLTARIPGKERTPDLNLSVQ